MHWLRSCLALATAATGTAQAVTTPRQFEVDIVFPHNETYKPADILPIVFAIQNATIPRSIGVFQLDWKIWICKGGQFNENTSIDVGWGTMQGFGTNETAADKPLFLVGFAMLTDWLSAYKYTPTVDDRYLLQWDLFWPYLVGNCTDPWVSFEAGRGAVMFNIQTVGGNEGSGQQGKVHDVQETFPECPEFGGIVQIGPLNATKPECPALDLLETPQGNPCAVTVDQAAASSISRRVTSSALNYLSVYHPATTTTTVSSSKSKAGVGPARTVQTALAAACVLCGLAL